MSPPEVHPRISSAILLKQFLLRGLSNVFAKIFLTELPLRISFDGIPLGIAGFWIGFFQGFLDSCRDLQENFSSNFLQGFFKNKTNFSKRYHSKYHMKSNSLPLLMSTFASFGVQSLCTQINWVAGLVPASIFRNTVYLEVGNIISELISQFLYVFFLNLSRIFLQKSCLRSSIKSFKISTTDCSANSS